MDSPTPRPTPPRLLIIKYAGVHVAYPIDHKEAESVGAEPYLSLSEHDAITARLVEALQFYAEAFDKKLTSSGMGEFTPFMVDRGARASAALDAHGKAGGK